MKPPAAGPGPIIPNTASNVAFSSLAAPPGPVPVPYPNSAELAPPPSSSSLHVLTLNSERQIGVSPHGARQLAAGRPLTSLGDQTRLSNAARAGVVRLSPIPMSMGDDAGVNGGVVSGGSWLSPSQARVIVMP